jgi:hypothetical protein
MTLYCRERVRRVVGGVPAVLHNRQLEVLGRDPVWGMVGVTSGQNRWLEMKPDVSFMIIGRSL